MRQRLASLSTLLAVAAMALPAAMAAADFPDPPDTTHPAAGNQLIAPAEALGRITLPPGFRATLFAGEPDVRQPIAMAFDPRGRLWVAENYTYAEARKNFDLSLHDRIVVFGDQDGDGRFDQRSVFWEGAQRLTSIALGSGGVYALCPPKLLFIPDADGDGHPDGEPQVLLDGFDAGPVRHNIANGLKWGPDGWLYGRHGIQAVSLVGLPGAPPAERIKLSCCTWRYHPTRRVFEVVTQGTTNSWGMDWDAHGEAFFINTVIGHLWHMIPGAHYRRMYGDDLDARAYGVIEQHADHVHWDASEKWNQSKPDKVSDGTSRAGGGHAHSGLMIYQGANWPAAWRDQLFTLNFHGRRLNMDVLEPQGSGFVGKHGADMVSFGDPWFRGVDLASGPDGGVFVLDWSDTGECHNANGVHRSSGRIFKITYGDPAPAKPIDLARLADLELVKLLQHADVWFERQARQLLQQRAAAGADLKDAAQALRALAAPGNDPVHRLRALWALHAIGAADEAWLAGLLADADEHVRVWALRLVTDRLPQRGLSTPTPPAPLSAATLERIAALARTEAAAPVRLALASALQRLPLSAVAAVAAPLLAHAEDAADHNLPAMLWYGVKDLAGSDPTALVALAKGSAIPLVRRYAARRLGEDVEAAPAPLGELLKLAAARDADFQADVLGGLGEALKGWRKARKPAGWDELQPLLAKHPDAAVRDRANQLNALFGDSGAQAENRRLALDPGTAVPQRRAALQALIESRPDDLRALCERLLDDRAVNAVAAHGLAAFDDAAIATLLVKRYRDGFAAEARPEVLSVLVSRPAFARVLVASIGPGEAQIPRADLTPFHVRQIRAFNDAALSKQLAENWGVLRDSSEDKLAQVAGWKAKLTPEALAKADKGRGRQVFSQTCSVCHKLFGEGAAIGPDLTGAGRDNLSYLLENIVDPSAVVAADYRLALVMLKNGQVLSGVINARTERTIAVQTMTERVTLERDDIDKIQESASSLMPEGLLQALGDDKVPDLIAYLMSHEQVPLPAK
jgi:putative membrane-bound dehydrogenase-like protein